MGLWIAWSRSAAVAVWDSGPLIDVEERERIFRRGERGRHGAKLSGTGLGLALARDQAEASGGSLQLRISASALATGLPAAGNAFVLGCRSAQQPQHQPAAPQREGFGPLHAGAIAIAGVAPKRWPSRRGTSSVGITPQSPASTVRVPGGLRLRPISSPSTKAAGSSSCSRADGSTGESHHCLRPRDRGTRQWQ